MEAIDYVKLFKLDQENYDFKREEFISELGKEFLEYCQTTTIGINLETKHIYYYRFREIVKNFQEKFWSISKLKIGEPFSEKLWNAFFATQVVPLRKSYSPKFRSLSKKGKGITLINKTNYHWTLKKAIMEKEILDLHGNKFKVGDYKLSLEIPIGKCNKLIFTRDPLSGETFNLFVKGKIYKAYFYNLSINCYVCYKLELVGYDESKDIRKAYLYGKRR